jgi:predicted MFS family arabinose efflux permease
MTDAPRPRSAWWVVAGCAVGLVFSTGPLLQFSFGAFIGPVVQSFGVDRGSVSLALLFSLGASGLMTPILGRIADRVGLGRVIVPVVACFGLAYASIGIFADSLFGYLCCYTVAGVFGAGQTPLLYAKAITASFDRYRGIALGVAMAGVGAGAAITPHLARSLVLGLGWRHAYIALGLVAVAISLPAVALVARNQPSAQPLRAAAEEGLGDPFSVGHFSKLAVAFFLVAVAASGVVAHLLPLLTDRGVAPDTATAAISAGGGALIFGRVLAGYCLDRLFAPNVAAAFFALPLLGIVLLLVNPSGFVAVGAAILVGLGLGAEMDLIAFLQSRYLGLVRFGELYGYLLMLFMLGSGVGPFVMGMSLRYSSSYSAALLLFAGGLAIACGLMLTLGAYRFVGAGARAARAC